MARDANSLLECPSFQDNFSGRTRKTTRFTAGQACSPARQPAGCHSAWEGVIDVQEIWQASAPCPLHASCNALRGRSAPDWRRESKAGPSPQLQVTSGRITHLENSLPLDALSGPFQKPFVWDKLAAGDVCRLGTCRKKMYFLTGRRSPGQRPLQRAAVRSEFPGSRSMWSQGITQALGLEHWPRKCSSNWSTSHMSWKVTLSLTLNPFVLKLGPWGSVRLQAVRLRSSADVGPWRSSWPQEAEPRQVVGDGVSAPVLPLTHWKTLSRSLGALSLSLLLLSSR